MIISHSRKFIFIKSRKTAGTSLESALSQFCSGDDIVTPLNDLPHNRNEKGEFLHKSMNAEEYRELGPNWQHIDAWTIKSRLPAEQWNSYFKVSIARNPWDRVVSDFMWLSRNDPALQPRRRFYHKLGIPFDEFREMRKRFGEFVRSSAWTTNDRFYIVGDQLCVDRVLRYEHLIDDFRAVCETIGVPIPELPRLKAGIRSGRRHYSEYYDEETIEIVGDRHVNDLRLLGYRFEKA
jgi:hypothetical protein